MPVPCGWNHQRRLSFLVMVLCFSRRMVLEFTLAETLEHFLAGQQNAFAQWGGTPKKWIVDNLKSAVLSHPAGQPAVYNPITWTLPRIMVANCGLQRAGRP